MDNSLNLINRISAQKMQKEKNKNYKRDSATDIIDIQGLLKWDINIPKCDINLFFYQSSLESNEPEIETHLDIDINKISFTIGNKIELFTSYFKESKIIGKGSFGLVVSGFDSVVGKYVAIKVYKVIE